MEELKKHNSLYYTLVSDYYNSDLQLPEEARSIATWG